MKPVRRLAGIVRYLSGDVVCTDMKDWRRKLDVTKVPRTFRHVLATCSTHGSSVDSSKFRVTQSFLSRPLLLLILDKESVTE